MERYCDEKKNAGEISSFHIEENENSKERGENYNPQEILMSGSSRPQDFSQVFPWPPNHSYDTRIMTEQLLWQQQINSYFSGINNSRIVETMQLRQQEWQNQLQCRVGPIIENPSRVDDRSKDKQPIELGGVGNTVQFPIPNPHTGLESLVGRDNLATNPIKFVPPLASCSIINHFSMDRVVAAGPTMPDDGISLRQWLIFGQQNMNKIERMYIFRQIVKLVDLAHSQQVVLQDMRPSYFKLLPSKKIEYVGSLVPIDCLENVIVQDTSNSDHHLSRKRYSEQGSHSNKSQKLNESMMFSRQNLQSSYFGHQLSTSLNFQLEEKWYRSPEELNMKVSMSSNIYNLGILLFELFCCFESWEVQALAMFNLCYRILPPKFLLENPKEAEFCLWLLHPEPSSRPSAREVLESQLIFESQELSLEKQLLSSIDEDDAEAGLLLDFLTSLNEQKEKHASKLIEEIRCLERDVTEVEKRHLLRANEFLSTKHERSMKNNQIEKAYFSMRSQIQLVNSDSSTRLDQDFLSKENGGMKHKPIDQLGSFFNGLCKYARYNKFELRATVRNSMINSLNVISSLSFDRDEDYFASAEFSNKIKIYEFNALLRNTIDIHYPVVEMPSKSKLSCVTWNNYIKNYLASTDYDGVVQLWDVNTGQGFSQFLEHTKKAWSVHFSPVDPTKFASGSDDCSIKVWNINEQKSISSIRCRANVCCVQFSPHSTNLLAFGCADYNTYCFDLRNTRYPWCTLGERGLGKTVSYVKFVDSGTLVSASIDSTLRLWDLHKTNTDVKRMSTDALSLTLKGHTNEMHFVGLTVSDNGYIACGSETNEVYAYYRSIPVPITSYQFGSTDPISGQETGESNGKYVSSVCWRSKSDMVVASNSSGCIKVLQLV